MPTIKYSIRYKKNEGLLMTPEELWQLHFYGVKIQSTDGSVFNPETIEFNIKSAQQEVEKFLEIRLQTRLVNETIDYFKSDYWGKFPLLRTTFPVKTPLSLIGSLNDTNQITYPKAWLSVKSAPDGQYSKKIAIVPAGDSNAVSGSVILSGITTQYGMMSQSHIPNYFKLQYTTGFELRDLPMDVIDLVGKYAAIKLFHIAGDLILGNAGIASMSLGVDGLSSSISSTSSATNAGYGARIIGYLKDIDNYSKKLKLYYKGINFTVL